MKVSTLYTDYEENNLFGRQIRTLLARLKLAYGNHWMILPQMLIRRGNEAMLQKMPHEMAVDFAMSVVLLTQENEKRNPLAGSLTWTDLERFEISKEALFDFALNMAQRFAPEKIGALMLRSKETGEIAEGLYLLTNEMELFGASCILYPGTLRRAAMRIGESFYLIPSSVHEWLLLRKSMRHTGIDQMREVILESNRYVISDPADVLSEEILYYDADTGTLFWWREEDCYEKIRLCF